MIRIMKHLKGQGMTVVIILLLLIVQAGCELALPQYTSNIIDTGIQNSGVQYVMPEKITVQDYEYVQMFMKSSEQRQWEKAYQKSDIGDTYERNLSNQELKDQDMNFVYPWITSTQMSSMSKEQFLKQIAAQSGMEASDISQEALGTYGKQLGVKIEFYQKTVEDKNGKKVAGEYIDMRPLLQAMEQNGQIKADALLQMRKQIEKGFSSMGDTMVKSTAIAYTVQAEQAAGVDIDQKQTSYLWLAGGKMLAMSLLMMLTAVFVGFFAARAGAGVGCRLRGRVFKKVVGYSDAEINQFSTASLITRSTNDIQQIQMVCTMLLRMLIYAPILGIGGVIKVIQTGAGMGCVIILAVIVITGFVMILMSIAMPKFKVMQKMVDRLNLVSREILTGLLVIRAFGREKREEERFEEANVDLTKTNLFTNRVMTFMMPMMMFMMNGLSVLIVWVAAHKIDAGTMQVGTMTAFITYAMVIVMSFLMLTMMSVMLPRAAVAAERIDEVLETEATIVDQTDAHALTRGNGEITFDHVSFRYPGAEENVLDDIDFVAKAGETTAIIGSTGCGKSTLVNLIPRFYDVTEGSIKIDGQDIRYITQSSLHEQIGYVPQKGILFSGTIASNLRFGKADATDEEIQKAASIAQAQEFIDGKENGYDSLIAQGGSNVSGGQKQRLSIARAIAKDPQIYIFDDSFSALDFKTDATLRQALEDNVEESTVLIVAQRISTILHADQILVLDDGEIVGKGTHDQLMANCEVYQQIAKSQLSEKELEENKGDNAQNSERNGKEEMRHE